VQFVRFAKGTQMFSKTVGGSFAESVVRRSPVIRVSAKAIVVKRPAVKSLIVKAIVLRSIVIFGGFLAISFNQTALAQSSVNSSAGLEFPVIMRKKVVAGVTPVGIVVQARLTVATSVDRVVVPENAILSGEVTQSTAKSDAGPSRLAIRMDSAQWKHHGNPQVLTLTKKVYLTAWSYSTTSTTLPDSLYEAPTDLPSSRNMTRLGSPSPPTRRISDTDDSSGGPGSKRLDSTAASNAAPHRVPMKDVESTRARDGAVALTSRHSTIKLDKSTTYAFAGGELAGGHV
jgi:hypothetical protein